MRKHMGTCLVRWMLTIVSLSLRVVLMPVVICVLSLAMLTAVLREREQGGWPNGKE